MLTQSKRIPSLPLRGDFLLIRCGGGLPGGSFKPVSRHLQADQPKTAHQPATYALGSDRFQEDDFEAECPSHLFLFTQTIPTNTVTTALWHPVAKWGQGKLKLKDWVSELTCCKIPVIDQHHFGCAEQARRQPCQIDVGT